MQTSLHFYVHAIKWQPLQTCHLPWLLESLLKAQFTPGFKPVSFLQVSVKRACLSWEKQNNLNRTNSIKANKEKEKENQQKKN